MKEGRLREVEEATDRKSVGKKWGDGKKRGCASMLEIFTVQCLAYYGEAVEYSIYMLNMEIMALKKDFKYL